MKFWEWSIFISGMLSALAADDSIFWCLVLGLVCAFSVFMLKVTEEVQAERRKHDAIKRADFNDAEADSEWVRRVECKPLPSNSTSIWEEYQ